jgi:hypothetical protein
MNFYLKRKWSLRVLRSSLRTLRDTFFTQRSAKDLRRERKKIDGIGRCLSALSVLIEKIEVTEKD